MVEQESASYVELRRHLALERSRVMSLRWIKIIFNENGGDVDFDETELESYFLVEKIFKFIWSRSRINSSGVAKSTLELEQSGCHLTGFEEEII